jgi:hypothetical protein
MLGRHQKQFIKINHSLRVILLLCFFITHTLISDLIVQTPRTLTLMSIFQNLICCGAYFLETHFVKIEKKQANFAGPEVLTAVVRRVLSHGICHHVIL